MCWRYGYLWNDDDTFRNVVFSQVVLCVIKLMGDEDRCVNIRVVFLSSMYLKHLGFKHTPSKVTRIHPTQQVRDREATGCLKLAIQFCRHFKIRNTFLNPCWFRRLREYLLNRGQPITILIIWCGKQIIQQCLRVSSLKQASSINATNSTFLSCISARTILVKMMIRLGI